MKCIKCFTKGLNITLGYVFCIGVIVLFLSINYSYKESFTPKYLRIQKNKMMRNARLAWSRHTSSLKRYIAWIKRKFL